MIEEKDFANIAPTIRQAAFAASIAAGATESDAEDVAQEVLIRFWQMRDHLDEFRSVTAMASRIAHNETLNQKRQRRSVPLEERQQQIACNNLPDVAVEENENWQWLEQRLGKLPTTEYTILKMRQVERKSIKEIATLLDLKETSVSTLLSKARHTLLNDIKRRIKQ